MASDHFSISISEKPVAEVEATFGPSDKHGADLRFHGVVRDSEDGRPILGIEYSHYDGMALAELEKIVHETGKSEIAHLVAIHHKIGFVKNGEASIVIRVQTPHSADAFRIGAEYLRQIKETVPIWKKPIFE
ncbi:MAG: molybdenum cofactor biosynthesis protein MoaE [Verrucomicrobiales bacterium]|nr:molybdenum cofactor biosynthesis protein MoaE [Verrucomicrobiales bacterium]